MTEAERGPDLCHQLLTSFLGVPAGQIWADYLLWEVLLNSRPDLRAIVEIGSWQGGFSRYLHVQAEARDMAFATYDVVTPEKEPPCFRQLDVFARPEEVEKMLAAFEPLVLLCDGGNKPRELQTFAPRLHPGSIVVVHDWLTETMPDDVPDCLTPIHEDYCDRLGSMSRVFEVVE